MYVYAGNLGNTIIGPLFVQENPTGELCLSLLEKIVDPLIPTSLENQLDATGNMILQKRYY